MAINYKSNVVEGTIIDVKGLSIVDVSKDVTKRVCRVKNSLYDLPIEAQIQIKYTGITEQNFIKALQMSPVMKGKFFMHVDNKIKISISIF